MSKRSRPLVKLVTRKCAELLPELWEEIVLLTTGEKLINFSNFRQFVTFFSINKTFKKFLDVEIYKKITQVGNVVLAQLDADRIEKFTRVHYLTLPHYFYKMGHWMSTLVDLKSVDLTHNRDLVASQCPFPETVRVLRIGERGLPPRFLAPNELLSTYFPNLVRLIDGSTKRGEERGFSLKGFSNLKILEVQEVSGRMEEIQSLKTLEDLCIDGFCPIPSIKQVFLSHLPKLKHLFANTIHLFEKNINHLRAL